MGKRLPSIKPVIKNHLLRTVNLKLCSALKDPRSPVNRQWTFNYLLQMLLLGMLSGCKTLREIETFSEGYDERIPDTTLNNLIVEVDEAPLRAELSKEVKRALRDHELPREEFPVRITAIDGKNVAISDESLGDFSQHHNNGTKDYYTNRVLRAFHVSNQTKLFLGQREIHGRRGEATEFCSFVDSLLTDYGSTDLLEVISLDAGMTSLNNANYLADRGLNYIMGLKGTQKALLANAKKHLEHHVTPDAETIDNVNGKTITRKFYRVLVPPEDAHGWEHLSEFWLTSQHSIHNATGKEETEDRYFLSSISPQILSDSEAQKTIRMHWGIENEGNWIFDVVLGEDYSPFARRAMKLISLLRMYVYNIISRLMNRRLRQAKARAISWGHLMSLVHVVLLELKGCHDFKMGLSSAFE